MILKSRNTINVKVDGSTVNVAGRSYKSAHVLIIGASELSMVVTPNRVELHALFDKIPEIQDSTPHLLKVSAPGATLELDFEGTGIADVREDGSDVVIRGDLLTFKFESETLGESVVLRVPKLTPLRVGRVEVKAGSRASVNAIIDPFIVGIATLYLNREARISLSGGGPGKTASIVA